MSGIGLGERRVLKEFQEGTYATWLKSFHALVGFEVPVEPNWESFFLDVGNNYSKESLVGCWKINFLDSTYATFKAVCQDEMGKEAVKSGLKKVILEGFSTTSHEKTTFDGGVFHVRWGAFNGNHSSGEEFAKYWQKTVEAKL
jgi:hypothetical protein